MPRLFDTVKMSVKLGPLGVDFPRVLEIYSLKPDSSARRSARGNLSHSRHWAATFRILVWFEAHPFCYGLVAPFPTSGQHDQLVFQRLGQTQICGSWLVGQCSLELRIHLLKCVLRVFLHCRHHIMNHFLVDLEISWTAVVAVDSELPKRLFFWYQRAALPHQHNSFRLCVHQQNAVCLLQDKVYEAECEWCTVHIKGRVLFLYTLVSVMSLTC